MYSSDGTILAALLGLIIIITFFIMASRLNRIMNAIEDLAELEFRKPENRKAVICPNCKGEFTTRITQKPGNMNCPKCRTIITV